MGPPSRSAASVVFGVLLAGGPRKAWSRLVWIFGVFAVFGVMQLVLANRVGKMPIT